MQPQIYVLDSDYKLNGNHASEKRSTFMSFRTMKTSSYERKKKQPWLRMQP